MSIIDTGDNEKYNALVMKRNKFYKSTNKDTGHEFNELPNFTQCIF